MNALFILVLLGFVAGPLVSFSFAEVRISILDIAVLILLGCWAVENRTRLWAYTRKFLSIFAPFLVAAIISLLFTSFRIDFQKLFISSLYLWRFLAYSSLLVIVGTSALKNQARLGLFIAGFTLAVLGLLQYFLYPNLRNLSYLGWDPHHYRLFATLLDPNFTGIILVLTLILGQFVDFKQKYSKLASLCLVSVALLLTYSRGSFVALVVVAVAYALIKKQFKALVVGGAVFIGMLFLLPRPSGEGVNLLRTISIGARLTNAQEAITIIRSSPIVGVGFNALRYARDPQFLESSSGAPAHSGAGFQNSYLFILATTGVVGLIGFMWMVRNLWQHVSKDAHMLVGLSLLAVGAHSLFDNSLFYPQVLVWLAILIGSLSNFTKSRLPKTK